MSPERLGRTRRQHSSVKGFLVHPKTTCQGQDHTCVVHVGHARLRISCSFEGQTWTVSAKNLPLHGCPHGLQLGSWDSNLLGPLSFSDEAAPSFNLRRAS